MIRLWVMAPVPSFYVGHSGRDLRGVYQLRVILRVNTMLENAPIHKKRCSSVRYWFGSWQWFDARRDGSARGAYC